MFSPLVSILCLLSSVGPVEQAVNRPANEIIPRMEQADIKSDSYLLGPEDVISVSVLRHDEFSGEYLIPASGIVQLKAVGEHKVTGLSLADVRGIVLHKLRDRLRNPEVSVSLKIARLQRVYVLGDVKLPGVYDWKPGWGINESLSAAGGLAPQIESTDCRVIVERAAVGQKRDRFEARLVEVLESDLATTREGLPLERFRSIQPGDVIRVQSVESIPVFVSGKVKTPGLYRLRRDSSGVVEAIAQAQGVIEGAAISTVRIVRTDGTEETVDLTGLLEKDSVRDSTRNSGGGSTGTSANLPKLRDGDIVLVPELLDRFAVLGFVTRPGFYSIPAGRRFTLAEALASAEGATQRGRISRVGLVRLEGGKEVRKVYDLGKYLRAGDLRENPDIRAGDVLFVPETNRVDLATVLSGISATGIFFNAVRR